MDLSIPFSWSSVPDAELYYLKVGTESGRWDLIDTGELPPTVLSREMIELPAMQTLYAQIWTRRAGAWAHEDIVFAVSRTQRAELYGPSPGGVVPDDNGFRFAWSHVSGADGYELQIGTCQGCSDVADSGVLSGTEWSLFRLPTRVSLYARILTRVGSAWSYRDSVFTAGAPLPPATIESPVDGQTNFDASTPFSWSEVTTGVSYRLQIGMAAGGNDVHDSGPIHVARRLVAGLSVGVPLFGTLSTCSGGTCQTTTFVFQVVSSVVSTEAQLQLSEWLTVRSRLMANLSHDVLQGTSLDTVVRRHGHARAFCTDYAVNLVDLVDDAGISLEARAFVMVFNPNGLDVHAAVEVLDPTTDTWFVLDPTFMLTVERASSGTRMSPETSPRWSGSSDSKGLPIVSWTQPARTWSATTLWTIRSSTSTCCEASHRMFFKR